MNDKAIIWKIIAPFGINRSYLLNEIHPEDMSLLGVCKYINFPVMLVQHKCVIDMHRLATSPHRSPVFDVLDEVITALGTDYRVGFVSYHGGFYWCVHTYVSSDDVPGCSRLRIISQHKPIIVETLKSFLLSMKRHFIPADEFTT